MYRMTLISKCVTDFTNGLWKDAQMSERFPKRGRFILDSSIYEHDQSDQRANIINSSMMLIFYYKARRKSICLDETGVLMKIGIDLI